MALSIPPVVSLQSLTRKQSMRRLSHSNHLDSSEMTPSEHSSIYDAAPSTTFSPIGGRPRSDETAHAASPQKLEAERQAEKREQADLGQHVGTKLFTIIEQKSVPSLKTMPSS